MTSQANIACALVADLLNGGARNASEILAAAEGASVSQRSIQRAAEQMGVVKTRAGFRGGWTWRLPAGEGGSMDMPTERQASSILGNIGVPARVEHTVSVKDREDSELAPSRAEVIADRLRKLEAGRGKVAPIHAGDPRLLRWVNAGISDPDLREAYELAVFALVSEKSPASVTAGFLDRYIQQVI